MPQEGFSLSDRAVYALLACGDPDVVSLVRAIEQIASDATLEDTLAGTDTRGRPIYLYRVRNFAILYGRPSREAPPYIVDIRVL